LDSQRHEGSIRQEVYCAEAAGIMSHS